MEEEMIKITNDYYVDTDNYNYIVKKKHILTESETKKRKNAKVGDIEYNTISYHMNLFQAVTLIYKKCTKKIAKQYNLEEYLKELKYMQEDFLKQLNENLKGKECKNGKE